MPTNLRPDLRAQPPGVAGMLRRRDAAVAWRRDHASDPNREDLWRFYIAGAVNHARLTRPERAATRSTLRAAERIAPWAAQVGDRP